MSASSTDHVIARAVEIFVVAVALGGVYVFLRELPALARYLHIRGIARSPTEAGFEVLARRTGVEGAQALDQADPRDGAWREHTAIPERPVDETGAVRHSH